MTGTSTRLAAAAFEIVFFLLFCLQIAQGENMSGLGLSIEQITSGAQHHFFGYIGQSQTIPWNASGRYIVALRSVFHDHMPRPDESADIILIEPENGNAVRKVDETRAWNLQQGTMLYWNPESPETQFFFNDRDPETNKVFAVLYDIEKSKRVREFRFEDTPFGNSGVAQNGGRLLGINYGRMARLREVTGYLGAYDWTGDEKAPDDDGIFVVDVNTGEKRLLVSFESLAEAVRPIVPEVDKASLYINHTLWSRDDERIYFYVRGNYDGKAMFINVPCTIWSDGTHLTAHAQFLGGHPEWADGRRVIGRVDDRQVLYDVDEKKLVGQIGTPEIIPNPGGDCSLSPGGDWFVSGYATGASNNYALLRQSDGATIRSPQFSRGSYVHGSLRIDPAPRWNRTNDAILVSAWVAETETRQLFVMRIVKD